MQIKYPSLSSEENLTLLRELRTLETFVWTKILENEVLFKQIPPELFTVTWRRELDTPLEQVMWNDIGRSTLFKLGVQVGCSSLVVKIRDLRDHLIRGNYRLVYKRLQGYHFPVPQEDLIQEGSIGLIVAIDRFDPAKGASLSTYSHQWIHHFALRANSTNGEDHGIPVNLFSLMLKYKRLIASFHLVNGRYPEDEEAAQLLKQPVEDAIKIKDLSNLSWVSLESGEDAGFVSQLSRIPAPFKDPADAIDQTQNLARVQKALACLPVKELQVLNLRFLNSDLTLEEVGNQLGVTRERVRQIQDKAFVRIRRRLAC